MSFTIAMTYPISMTHSIAMIFTINNIGLQYKNILTFYATFTNKDEAYAMTFDKF